MAMRPTPVVRGPFFYPVGNTPAVCLTQALPPDQDADLLLLGCGDIRNILFTSYSGAGLNGRRLDFTCCDLEAEIIARNALALTFILDDKKGTRVRQLWNMYYHVFIDGESASLLRSQSRKLSALAQSLESWNEGPYGATIQFCDSTTLGNVLKLWDLYAAEPAHSNTYDETQTLLKAQWNTAKKYHEQKVSSNGYAGDGGRASAPLLTEGFEDSIKQFRTYWQSGTCLEDKKIIDGLSIANPMFICRRGDLMLHYGTNPLTGFHLAPMHAQLSADSPLLTSSGPMDGKLSKAMQTAISQLSAWSSAFKKMSTRVTIRYINCDALAFCRTLQEQVVHGESSTADWYRDMWTYAPLVIDAAAYAKGGSAPRTFNVIDTSNLLDHLGCLNVLTATASLVRQNVSSILRTEILIVPESSDSTSATTLLCGDLPTVALLLGLKPVQYWTNATPVWHLNLANSHGKWSHFSNVGSLSRPIILWKPFDTSKVRYDPDELARVLISIYRYILLDERYLGCLGTRGSTFGLYSPASFVSLLQYIKASKVVDWASFIQAFFKQGFMYGGPLNTCPYKLQSLLVHLDVLSVCKVEDHFDWWQPRKSELGHLLYDWEGIPPILNITLSIPHERVRILGDIVNSVGTTLGQLSLDSSSGSARSVYPDIQMGFGTIKSSGAAFTNNYRLTFLEDEKGWQGDSPLIVSATVSTRSLIEHTNDESYITFEPKATFGSIEKFMTAFGPGLAVYRSAVGQHDVFVSPHSPNLQKRGSVNQIVTSESNEGKSPAEKILPVTNMSSASDVIATIHPIIATGTNSVKSLRVRYVIHSGGVKRSLQSGKAVTFSTPTTFSLTLNIGDRYRKDLTLPFPLDRDSGKVKIARKSLWIEYTAAVQNGAAIFRSPDNMMPVHLNEQYGVSLEQLHYVQPDVLPKLHIGPKPSSAAWVDELASANFTMSAEEFRDYNVFLRHDHLPMPGRLGVKETLKSIYTNLVGAEDYEQVAIFQLSDFGRLYVDSVRMDVSNQTYFADAAFIPCHQGKDMMPVAKVMDKRGDKMVCLQIEEDEATFWKHILPGFAERCRFWKHKPTCEYKIAKHIPISTGSGKRYMCTCGIGAFPADYLKHIKRPKDLCKFAVRVAIPVIFASPIHAIVPPVAAPVATPSPPPQTTNLREQAPVGQLEPRLSDLSLKKDTCFECGVGSCHNGSALLECAGCKYAQYCSKECQRKDWKKGHKQLCAQLKEG